MDAVLNFLLKENCSIEINVLDKTIKKLAVTPVEFVITLPTRLFEYMGEY